MHIQRVMILDMLARGPGKRLSTLDVLGAGPRTIAGVLEKHGLEPIVVPGELFLKEPRMAKGYSALFISGMSSDIKGAEKAIRLWKKYNGGPVVTGGPMSQDAPRLLDSGADLAVIGEAEETLDELLKTGFPQEIPGEEELKAIRGLAFRDPSGKIAFTGKRPRLSAYKLSRYWASTEVIEHYPGFWYMRVYVEVVRGCSNVRVASPPHPGAVLVPKPGCAYCSVVSLWGPARSMPIERIVKEVRGLVEKGVRRIVLSGPDILDYGRDRSTDKGFVADPEQPPPNLAELERLFKNLYSIPEIAAGEVILMAENTKPTTVTRETASLLGYYMEGTPIHLGVESGDDTLLIKMARPGDSRRALEAVKLLIENKIRPYVYLIYGLPGQGRESVSKTLSLINELEKLGVEKITLYRFTPLPETAYERMSPGDPSEPWNKVLIERVKTFNEKAKQRLIGTKINTIIVGKRKNRLIAYPVKHGPVVLVDLPEWGLKSDLMGRKAKVVITRVEGERLVRGKIVTLGRNISRLSIWEKSVKYRFSRRNIYSDKLFKSTRY